MQKVNSNEQKQKAGLLSKSFENFVIRKRETTKPFDAGFVTEIFVS